MYNDQGDLSLLSWIVLFAILAALCVMLFRRERKKHLRAVAWAKGRGWTYTPIADHMAERWNVPPFGRGVGRRAWMVLTGTSRGQSVVSMEYEYETGSGGKSRSHYFHVVALHLPAPLPWLRLTPENVGTVIAEALGGQDVTFESAEFNRNWRVQGPEGQFPYDVIHPRMMERLLEPDARGRSISIEGQDILLHVSGRQEVEMIDSYVELLHEITELIPQHVWRRVAHEPGV